MDHVDRTPEQNQKKKLEFLERKIQALQSISQRFSIYRMLVFSVGVLCTWLATVTTGSRAGWFVFALALCIFLGIVFFHQRLETWIRKFQHWQQINQQQLARSQLDWENLPYRRLPEQRVRNALEIDLDLTGPRSLHHLIDQSISEQGSQRLADWLSHPQPDLEEIYNKQKWVQELFGAPLFGMRLQLVFRLAARERIRGDQIVSWLKVEFPLQKLRWSLPVAALLAFLTLGLFLANAAWGLPAYWIFSALIYLAFYNFTGRENMEILDQVARLDAELGKLRPVLQYLERAAYRNLPAIAELCQPFHQSSDPPSAILRRLKWVTAAVGLRMNPVMGLLLNIFLPWDYFWAFLALRFRNRLAVKLPLWLDRLYQLEALISLADFSRSQAGSSFPVISQQSPSIFQVEEMSHPLLSPQTRVANNFSLQNLGEVALITGSNMAGKSTFIKAVGANLCLAYAGSAVLASAWHSRPLRLHSCIRISDSISDGFSYFYAEVKCLSSLLSKLNQPFSNTSSAYPVLYLIDEIFRGTNNRERLIGSKAYLQAALHGNGAGLVATHDLELATLAEQNPMVKNYHFRDQVEESRLVFDYQIRQGASPTTNALRIMAMEGLPVPDLELDP